MGVLKILEIMGEKVGVLLRYRINNRNWFRKRSSNPLSNNYNNSSNIRFMGNNNNKRIIRLR